MTNSPETKTEVMEGSDGRIRIVTYNALSKIVLKSTVLAEPKEQGWSAVYPTGEAIEKMGLNERQKKGLGIPQGVNPYISEYQEKLDGDIIE